jgi:Na+-transporting methylmalonyl-CoA/oxaloacetate decarboxylase gamma subunit
MSNLAISLWITLIGILLIFAAILILWGAMELLVRVTTPKKKEVVKPEQTEEIIEAVVPEMPSDGKRKAAIAAVAAALAFQKSSASLSAAPESSALSAWQVAPMQK